ncbi:GNAT family N-acetyltransferase [Paraburkholderia hospita]|jgi:GNAT superfamily N-acetyltransferase|uniref:GNAT family N-acetyltransferase n=1 Tax=Paraburkholderia hospita TaxID=169430 RepID=UPI000DEFDFE4|nr:GNAT family N-acetyltransferase [Paraburkholderia hospita]AXF04971.1 N-acetyltransferase [Paraburkholderia hospita]
MSKRRATAAKHAPVDHVRPSIRNILLRRFDPSRDSYEQLTTMLHHAFARLGMMGLNCTCVDQDVAVTMRRAKAGDCFVVVSEGKVIGTMTLYAPDNESACEHYHRRNVATIRQLAIDPSWQNRGIGKSLLAFAEHWAATRGYSEIALDTPYPASHLVAFYRGQGFRIVDAVRFAGKVYESAVLSKAPVVARTLAAWTHQIALPSARYVRFAA